MTFAEFLNSLLEDRPFSHTSLVGELRCDRCGGYWTVNGQSEDWNACPLCLENGNDEAAGLFDRPQTPA